MIIGCCADKEQTKSIIKLSKRHLGVDIPILKANKDKYDFGLNLEQIE